jgi:hypothetical protein
MRLDAAADTAAKKLRHLPRGVSGRGSNVSRVRVKAAAIGGHPSRFSSA